MILQGKKSNFKLIFRNEILNPHIFFVYKRYKEKSQQYIRKAKLYKNMIWIFYIRGKSWILYRIGSIPSILKKFHFNFSRYEKYVDSNGNISDEDLTNLIYEIIRLWPPFFGGLRVAQMDFCYGPYCVPKGK